MLGRIKDTCSTYGMAVLNTPGRLASSAGGALFGAKKFLEYAYHNHAPDPYRHPFSIITVSANVVINAVSRIPALFRQEEAPPEVAGEQAYTVEENDVMEDDGTQSSFPIRSLSIFLRGACYLANGVSLVGTALGSYNSGKVLCEFIDAHINTNSTISNPPQLEQVEEPNDQEWKYYVFHGVALYLMVANLHAYYKYVTVKAVKNTDHLVDLIAKQQLSQIDKKTASTAVIVGALNLSTTVAFNYISNKYALVGINHDLETFPAYHIPPSVRISNDFIMYTAGFISGFGLITDIMTYIPSLYEHLKPFFLVEDRKMLTIETNGHTAPNGHAIYADDEIVIEAANTNAENENNKTKELSTRLSVLKYGSLTIGVVDAASTGAQGYSSVALTAHDFFGVHPYGYIIELAFLCALSKAICHFSFNVKIGVDEFVEKLSEKENINERTSLLTGGSFNRHRSVNGIRSFNGHRSVNGQDVSDQEGLDDARDLEEVRTVTSSSSEESSSEVGNGFQRRRSNG